MLKRFIKKKKVSVNVDYFIYIVWQHIDDCYVIVDCFQYEEDAINYVESVKENSKYDLNWRGVNIGYLFNKCFPEVM